MCRRGTPSKGCLTVMRKLHGRRFAFLLFMHSQKQAGGGKLCKARRVGRFSLRIVLSKKNGTTHERKGLIVFQGSPSNREIYTEKQLLYDTERCIFRGIGALRQDVGAGLTYVMKVCWPLSSRASRVFRCSLDRFAAHWS